MRQRLIGSEEKRIGERLKELRMAAGLSCRPFADRLGTVHSRVVKVEAGDQRIALDEFVLWCEAAGR